jgi:hypothetical protein
MKKVIAVLMVLVVSAVLAFAAEVAKDGRFIAYDNDTVLDKQAKLMWAAKDNGRNISWADAKKYCEKYRGGGYSDWRMPTQDEIQALYDATKVYKADCGFDVYITKLVHLTCIFVWASNTFGSEAASMYFGEDGGQMMMAKKSLVNNYRALPVRAAK